MKKHYVLLLSAMVVLAGCSAQGEIPMPEALITSTPQSIIKGDVFELPNPTVDPQVLEPGEENECENPFYPVSDEATWTYVMSSGEEVVHTLAADTFGSFVIDVTSSSGSTARIEGQCTEEGIVIMNTAGATTTVSNEEGGSTVNTQDSSGVTLPKDIGLGEQWSQIINVSTQLGNSEIQSDYLAVGFENITVPAGEFYTLKVEQGGYVTVFGQKIKMHGYIWYAEGVGVVRSAMDGAPSIELVSFDIPD